MEPAVWAERVSFHQIRTWGWNCQTAGTGLQTQWDEEKGDISENRIMKHHFEVEVGDY